MRTGASLEWGALNEVRRIVELRAEHPRSDAFGRRSSVQWARSQPNASSRYWLSQVDDASRDSLEGAIHEVASAHCGNCAAFARKGTHQHFILILPPPDESGQIVGSMIETVSKSIYNLDGIEAGAACALAIVASAIDGIITISDHGDIQTINNATEAIFGYTEEELLGRNVKMLMPEPYHSQHDQYLDNYRTTGVKRIIGIGREVVGKRKDGTLFPIDLAITETNVRRQDPLCWNGTRYHRTQGY